VPSTSARYQAPEAPQTHLHDMLHRTPRALTCPHTTMPPTTLTSHSGLPAIFLKQLPALAQTPSTAQTSSRPFSLLTSTGALPYLPPRPARRSCSTRRPLGILNPRCTFHSQHQLCSAARTRNLNARDDGRILRESPQRSPPGNPHQHGLRLPPSKRF